MRVHQNDLQKHGDKLIKVFVLNDQRKRAKKALIKAQKDYDDICASLTAEKAQIMSMFDELNS